MTSPSSYRAPGWSDLREAGGDSTQLLFYPEHVQAADKLRQVQKPKTVASRRDCEFYASCSRQQVLQGEQP